MTLLSLESPRYAIEEKLAALKKLDLPQVGWVEPV